MVDSPGILVVRDGATPSNARNLGVMVDGTGAAYSQQVIRFDGVQAGAEAPFPTVDPVVGTALGAPADAAWTVGSGSVVALLKALWAAITGTLTVSRAPFALINSVRGTMGVAATIVVPFSGTRKWLLVSNRTTGTETQDIGSANVTVLGGIPIAPGGGFLFDGAGAVGPIYGITTIANSPFSYVEG